MPLPLKITFQKDGWGPLERLSWLLNCKDTLYIYLLFFILLLFKFFSSSCIPFIPSFTSAQTLLLGNHHNAVCEISQSEKDKYPVISHIGGVNWTNWTNRQNRNRLLDREQADSSRRGGGIEQKKKKRERERELMERDFKKDIHLKRTDNLQLYIF